MTRLMGVLYAGLCTFRYFA